MSNTAVSWSRRDAIEKGFRVLQITATLFVTVVACALLWYHAAPTVSFHDAGEFVLAAAGGGLPHPPGAPTWVLGAGAFLKLTNYSDPAYACNLFSGLLGAVTLGLVYYLSTFWIKKLTPELRGWQILITGLMPPLILLHSPAFLEQAFTTEQYTFMTAIQAALLVCFAHGLVRVFSASRLIIVSLAIGFLWGLGVGNHPSQICLVLPVAWFLYRSGRLSGYRSAISSAIAVVAGLIIGLSVFLYLPYVAFKQPPPFIDWIKADSFERFNSAILRKAWDTRSLAEAPKGFIREWFLTYDFIGQLGFVGFLLTVAGIAVGMLRRWNPLLVLSLIVVPYAAGLLYGHLKQANIDNSYLRIYGIQDWHLPLYMAGSLSTVPAIAFLIEKTNNKRRLSLIVALPIAVAIIGISSVINNSLRHWKGPQNYIEDILSSVPQDSVIVAGGDSMIFMLGYSKFLRNPPAAFDIYFQTHFIKKENNSNTLSRKEMVAYIEENITAKRQPYKQQNPVDLLSIQTLLLSYQDPSHGFDNNAEPAGFLCRFVESRTTETVLAAEMKWRKEHPQGLRLPDLNSHRLEREAYGLIYLHRGNFFANANLLPLAIEEYKRSVKWLPNNSFGWLALGLAYEAEDKAGNRELARTCYEAACETAPESAEAYFRLGTLLVNSGKISQGLENLNHCLELKPDHTDAQANKTYAQSLLAGQ